MSAFGVVLVGLGILAVWSSFKRVYVTDVLKSLVNSKAVTKGKTTSA